VSTIIDIVLAIVKKIIEAYGGTAKPIEPPKPESAEERTENDIQEFKGAAVTGAADDLMRMYEQLRTASANAWASDTNTGARDSDTLGQGDSRS
jgi:hypothetical protein